MRVVQMTSAVWAVAAQTPNASSSQRLWRPGAAKRRVTPPHTSRNATRGDRTESRRIWVMERLPPIVYQPCPQLPRWNPCDTGLDQPDCRLRFLVETLEV